MALDFGKLNFSTSFNRTAAFPLDAKSYFESLTAAQAAANSAEEAGSSSTVYYFGEQVVVVESDVATVYVIEKVTDTTEKGYHGELKEVGSKTLGDDKSIVLDDETGILSLNDYGKHYWKYVAAAGETEAHYEYVEGFKEGLIPQIKKRKVGEADVYKLEWYEQNPTTVEGLAGRLTAVEGRATALEEGKVDKVSGKSLVSDTEITKLAGVSEGANKVTVTTEKSGKIEIDGVQKQITPDNLVTDADYKHITVTNTSVSDGTNTFNKYDDTALAGRVTTAEGKITTLETKVGDSGDAASASGSLYARIKQEASDRSSADSALDVRVRNLEARGRYLSAWDVATGLPADYPTVPSSETGLTYTYTFKAGDYYIVSNVPTTGTKYMPDGASITATRTDTSSAWVWTVGKKETTESISKGDQFVYSTSSWTHIAAAKDVNWGQITGTLSSQTDLQQALDTKLEGVKIGTTSATVTNKVAEFEAEEAGALALKDQVSKSDLDTSLSGELDAKATKTYVDTELAKKQDTLSAGKGISISSNTVAIKDGYTGDYLCINGGNAALSD